MNQEDDQQRLEYEVDRQLFELIQSGKMNFALVDHQKLNFQSKNIPVNKEVPYG